MSKNSVRTNTQTANLDLADLREMLRDARLAFDTLWHEARANTAADQGFVHEVAAEGHSAFGGIERALVSHEQTARG